MPYYMYVAVSEDNKISVFTVDPETGGLTHQHDVPVQGGPFTLAISPDRNHLYCGTRETPGLTSFRIDQSGGGLTQTGSVPLDSWPVYVDTDRRGRFVLSSYYQGARVAVHPVGDDGSVGEPPVVSLETATGAHAMQTDPTNRYAIRSAHRGERSQPGLAIPFRRRHRPDYPQLSSHSGAGRVPGASPLLLSSFPGRFSISPTSRDAV